MPAVYRLRPKSIFSLSHAILTGCLIGMATWSPARAGSAGGHGRMPEIFNLAACYQIVQREGRMIAWARWEENFSLDKTRQGRFAEDTPVWIMQLINGWVEDAYAWRVTDDQVQRWADELGEPNNLPKADALSVHEMIAMWMRRLSRDCDAHDTPGQANENDSIVARGAGDDIHGQ